ncbi:hypothetical protein MKW98_027891, partial [Papaver atlanticum]
QRFIIDEFYKDYYLGKMGCYLKEARSRKAGKILALDELEEEEREKRLAALKPENDTVNEWEEFVRHVCLEEFRKEGKEPNPGVMEALEKIEKAVEDHGVDIGTSVTDDLLVRALGDEKPGKLRGIGYGETKTNMAVKTHYKKIIKECRDSMKEVNERLSLLEEKTSSCVCRGGSHLHNVSPKSGNASNAIASTSRTVPHHENDSPISIPRVEEVLGNDKACRLLSWYNENEVVADGIIAETDPKMECHGMPIGFAAYKVTVITSHVDDAILYKKTGELKRVIEAVGTYTPWAKDLILPAI